MQHHLRKFAVALSLATTGAVALAVISGTNVAGASTRFRSGAIHDRLLSTSRVASNSSPAAGLHLTGPDVMASFVALMAILAFGFLVVTFIRRRASLPA